VLEVDLSEVEIVAITIEPAGGSPQPTTDLILTAEI
jgi:anti-sigma-K factor RskA